MSDPTRSARPPLRPIPFGRWLWQLAKDVVKEYGDDGVGDLAASTTFWTLLSIPASVLALLAALGSVERLIGTSAAIELEAEIQDFVSSTFADSQALNDAVSELFAAPNGGLLTFATLIAFFTLSRGFAGLIRALDRAYEVEEARPFWRLRLVAIGFGLATVLVATGSAIVLAAGPEMFGQTAYRLLAVPAAFLVLVVWAATLFHVGPNHRTPWRYDLPGAIATAIGWVLATQLFALYVRLAPQGNQVTTTVGAVLLALTLMHVLSIVMLLGAEVNDVISRRAGVVQQPLALRERYGQVVDKFNDRT